MTTEYVQSRNPNFVDNSASNCISGKKYFPDPTYFVYITKGANGFRQSLTANIANILLDRKTLMPFKNLNLPFLLPIHRNNYIEIL